MLARSSTDRPSRRQLSRAATAAPSISREAALRQDHVHSQRSIKSLLFADFAGYSRLHDAYAPLFQSQFLEIGADAIAASPVKPLEAKTWGDGMYLVFESQGDAAGVRAAASGKDARRRLDRREAARVEPDPHRAPCRPRVPRIRSGDGPRQLFRADVTRTARIEPVTPPGMVYVSEAFAATLAATGQDRYALEYVGRLALAKGYGESRIYRLERR